MLNEDKIKLMTGIAMFEKKEGKKIFPIIHYFRSDFISSHMIRSFISFTICYLLGAGIWVMYRLDKILNIGDTEEILFLAAKLLAVYLIGLVVYLGITYYVYSKRYSYASSGIKVYISKLKRLDKRYEFQAKSKELKKGGR